MTNFDCDLLELLQRAGFISVEARTRVSESQKFNNGLHVGQILIMQGSLTPRELKPAFDALDAVKDGQCHLMRP